MAQATPRHLAASPDSRRRRLWKWIVEGLFDDDGGNCAGHICCDDLDDRHHFHAHEPGECNACEQRRKAERVAAR